MSQEISVVCNHIVACNMLPGIDQLSIPRNLLPQNKKGMPLVARNNNSYDTLHTGLFVAQCSNTLYTSFSSASWSSIPSLAISQVAVSSVLRAGITTQSSDPYRHGDCFTQGRDWVYLRKDMIKTLHHDQFECFRTKKYILSEKLVSLKHQTVNFFLKFYLDTLNLKLF